MILLAIDTASILCAACLLDTATDAVLGHESRDIGKGHAETLMEVIATALARAGAGYPDIGGVAVSVGPGSFTGVRIGVATARGLALALQVPSTGVTTLEAMAAEAREAFPGRDALALIDAKRDEIYAVRFDPAGIETAPPAALTIDQAVSLAGVGNPVLTGTGAALVEAALPATVFDVAERGATAGIASFARVAAARGFGGPKPAPLYLRSPDARPQQGFALPRRSGAV